jgi:hypothetical protein
MALRPGSSYFVGKLPVHRMVLRENPFPRWLVTKTIVSPVLVCGSAPSTKFICGKVQSHRIVSRFTVFEPD